MRIASAADLVNKISFEQGIYDVCAVSSDDTPPRSLLSLEFARDDEEATRHVPEIEFPSDWERPPDRNFVCCALVRAGVKHPGVEDEDLRRLHQEATRTRHIELFADLNAISTGFLSYLARSLGRFIARVVVSSSCIDILHEYQGRIDRKDARGGELLRRAEMTRVLRSLEEMRRHVPVHIHQLPPGATRYFQRNSAGPARHVHSPDARPESSEEDPPLGEERTFISEDRQMIAAFWEYMSKDNPRIPVFLVTSDFALAHVCAAERVPFIYARSPQTAWPAASPRVSPLWLDPFAPALRFCTAQQILWELCLVFVIVFVDEFELVWNSRRDRRDQFLQSLRALIDACPQGLFLCIGMATLGVSTSDVEASYPALYQRLKGADSVPTLVQISSVVDALGYARAFMDHGREEATSQRGATESAPLLLSDAEIEALFRSVSHGRSASQGDFFDALHIAAERRVAGEPAVVTGRGAGTK